MLCGGCNAGGTYVSVGLGIQSGETRCISKVARKRHGFWPGTPLPPQQRAWGRSLAVTLSIVTPRVMTTLGQ